MAGDCLNPAFALDRTAIRNVRATGSTVMNLLYTGLGISSGTVTRAYLWDIAAGMAIGAAAGVGLWNMRTGRRVETLRPEDFLCDAGCRSWRLCDYHLAALPAGRETILRGLKMKDGAPQEE